jgi:hypothetical protein
MTLILSPSPRATTTPHEAVTYAQATSCTAPDPPAAKKEDDVQEQSHSPPPERLDARAWGPDLVFRFNLSPVVLTVWPSPAQLFFDITKKSVIGDLQLAGIRWTPRGNRTFTFLHDKKFTAEEARKWAPGIWNLIRPLLKQPKHHCPRVDSGGSWHNVVIHGVPVHVMPPNAANGFATPQESATIDIGGWLKKSSVGDYIQAMSFMCSDTDLAA